MNHDMQRYSFSLRHPWK